MNPRLLALLSFAALQPIQAGGIYWSNRASGNRGIRVAELDGSNPAPIAGLQSRSDPRGVVADPVAGKLYFNDGTVVVSVNFDFTAKTAGALSNIGTGTGLRDLCLDRKNQYLYLADESAARIDRIALPGASADGAGASFPKSVSAAYYLDVAETAGGWPAASGAWKLFAGNSGSSLYAMDGPVGPVSVSPLSLPAVDPPLNNIRGVQIDAANGWLYWCEKDSFRIRRAKYDGGGSLTNVQSVHTGLCAAHGLYLDQPRGKLYWVDSGTNASGIGKGGVNRGSVDGTGSVETLVLSDQSFQPWDLDVDVSVRSQEEWLRLYFRKDASAAEKLGTADPDGDGFSNNQEFLLAMNPLRSDQPPTVASIWRDPSNGNRYPAISFLRRPLIPGIVSTPSVSVNLKSWSTSMIQVETAPADEGMERVTFRSDTPLGGTDRQFMRLSVTGS